jgi:tetratricopeptide (TPR) repeat protein
MADSPRIEELRRRLQADPGSVAFAALGEEYRRQGQLREAVETCRTGLARHPGYASAHVTLGRALASLGRPDEACRHLEKALQIAPENLVAAKTLGDVLKETGRLAEALERFRQALALVPGDAGLQAEVALLEQQVGPAVRAASAAAAPAARPAAPVLTRLERLLEAIGQRRNELNRASQEPTGVL